MKMKNKIKAVIAAALLMSFGAVSALAEEENTLTINYNVEGAEFSIYKAGEFTESNTFYLSGSFAGYADSVSLNCSTASEWGAAASTLYNYAVTDSAAPLGTATVSGGTAQFTGLERGLYLVSPTTVTTGGYIYTSQSFLVCLPNLTDELEWTNNVGVSPKYTMTDDSSGGGGTEATEDVTLVVVWVNDTDEIRPDSAEYTFYMDGEYYSTILLDEDNNWQYVLKDADSAANTITQADLANANWEYGFSDVEVGHTWTVVQSDLPEGYSTTIESLSRTSLVVTNTYTYPESSEETTVESTTEVETETAAEDTKTTTKKASSGGGHGGGDSVIIGGEETTTAQDEDSEVTTEKDIDIDNEDNTNTDKDSESEAESEEESENPGESDPYDIDEDILPAGPEVSPTPGSSSGSSSLSRKSSSGEKLPQTGQLWTPVPVLVICGIVLFIIGYVRFKRNEDE
ncbi:MAG: hypothetical protein LUD77_07360 [Clostridiales bacterium]|nr:hypothetical protein [Clostridiales bacterium]